MNTIIKKWASLFLAVTLLVSMVGCTSGCKSTDVPTTAYQVERAAAITAETALAAWNDWIPVGNPSTEQRQAVRDAYAKYQGAQVTLLDAAIAYKQTQDAPSSEKLGVATAAAGAALADLVSLVRQFGVKI